MQYAFFFLSLLSFIRIKQNTSHGSARFANITDLIQRNKKDFKDINLLNKKGVVLGRYGHHVLRDNSDTHDLVIAPTRGGKGIGIILPTLLDTWNESVVVLDLKGENYVFTADYRREKMNNKVFLIDYKENSCHYNPIAEIAIGTGDEITDARVIADIIINTGETEKNRKEFWNTFSVDILTGVILYKLYIDREKTNLYEVVRMIKEKNLKETIENCNKNILREKEIFNLIPYYPNEDILLSGEHPFINRVFSQILETEDKVYKNVVSTLNTKLSLYETPSVVEQTHKSDFRLEDIANYKNPCSLFIKVNPNELDIFAPLVNILIAQLSKKLLNSKFKENDIYKNKNRTLFILDEFPVLGYVEEIRKGVSFVAGYGVKYMIIIQSLDQLSAIYGEKHPFMSNCQVKVFYTPNETSTAKYISEICGVKTIKVNNGKTTQLQARKLITDDEVLRYSSMKGFIHAGNKPIIKSTNIRYFEDKLYKDRACHSAIRQDTL